jgi:hypothetical protein
MMAGLFRLNAARTEENSGRVACWQYRADDRASATESGSDDCQVLAQPAEMPATPGSRIGWGCFIDSIDFIAPEVMPVVCLRSAQHDDDPAVC